MKLLKIEQFNTKRKMTREQKRVKRTKTIETRIANSKLKRKALYINIVGDDNKYIQEFVDTYSKALNYAYDEIYDKKYEKLSEKIKSIYNIMSISHRCNSIIWNARRSVYNKPYLETEDFEKLKYCNTVLYHESGNDFKIVYVNDEFSLLIKDIKDNTMIQVYKVILPIKNKQTLIDLIKSRRPYTLRFILKENSIKAAIYYKE